MSSEFNLREQRAARVIIPLLCAGAVVSAGLSSVAAYKVVQVYRQLPVKWHSPFESSAVSASSDAKRLLARPSINQQSATKLE